MNRTIYALAESLQRKLGAISLNDAPRVMIDAWASLYRWHVTGERVWRISDEQADRLMDEPLPPALNLATAPVRGEAVAYQLPDRSEWIVLARHAPAPCLVVVHGDCRWSYAQPVLTYCTELPDGSLASGYFSLADMPTPSVLELRPGMTMLSGPLTAAEIAEEDYRVSLAIAQHYRP